jgi:hypothetical protein
MAIDNGTNNLLTAKQLAEAQMSDLRFGELFHNLFRPFPVIEVIFSRPSVLPVVL